MAYALYENCYNAFIEWLEYCKENGNYVKGLSRHQRIYLSYRRLISQQKLDYVYTSYAVKRWIEEHEQNEISIEDYDI